MRASDLPALQSNIPNALQLQRQIARAVGAVQARAARTAPGTVPASRDLLKSLFTAANDALDAISLKARSLDVTPNSPATLDVSSATTQQLVATVQRQAATAVVTGSTTWVSSDPTIATVSSGGLVTPVAPGSCTVTGTYQGVSDSVTINVQA